MGCLCHSCNGITCGTAPGIASELSTTILLATPGTVRRRLPWDVAQPVTYLSTIVSPNGGRSLVRASYMVIVTYLHCMGLWMWYTAEGGGSLAVTGERAAVVPIFCACMVAVPSNRAVELLADAGHAIAHLRMVTSSGQDEDDLQHYLLPGQH